MIIGGQDPAQQFHHIAFAPRRAQWGAARSAPVQFLLDGGQVQLQPCGTSVDHATDGGSMAFAEGRETEKLSEAVTRHGGEDSRPPGEKKMHQELA
jgi:hypothetical protein